MIKIGKVKLGVQPTVCAVLQDSFGLRTIRKLKLSGIQLVELRIDQFRRLDLSMVLKKIALLKRNQFSVIATIRCKNEGGEKKIPERKRLALYKSMLPFVDAVDVELKSKICCEAAREAKKKKKKTIVSFHDFHRTPPPQVLLKYLKQAKARGADIVKIATFAKRREDFLVLMNLTVRHRQDRLITISMGRLGISSRVLFPLCGSLISYGYAEKATAPGQSSAWELKEALHVESFEKR